MEIVKRETAEKPLIVFFADPEKVLLQSYELYKRFEQETETLTGPVIFVACCTSSAVDEHNEPATFVVSKGGMSTALLDISFFENLVLCLIIAPFS